MKNSTANLYLNDTEHLTINGINNFHVQKIEVYTGDDDYLETDCIEVTAQSGALTAKQLLTNKVKISQERIRYEAGVRIFLDVEGDDDTVYVVSICHHKGCINIRAEKAGDGVENATA